MKADYTFTDRDIASKAGRQSGVARRDKAEAKRIAEGTKRKLTLAERIQAALARNPVVPSYSPNQRQGSGKTKRTVEMREYARRVNGYSPEHYGRTFRKDRKEAA